MIQYSIDFQLKITSSSLKCESCVLINSVVCITNVSIILFYFFNLLSFILKQQVENCLTTYDPHAFVLVYSITDRSSFQFAEEILKYLWQESCTKEKAVILVGNKVDLARSRIIKCEGEFITWRKVSDRGVVYTM